jgi:homoserine kinase
MTLTVRVPASTSNLGAGFDFLGLALDLWLEARLTPGSGEPQYSGAVTGLRADTDFIYSHLVAAGTARDHQLHVHSDIPMGRGLGSSAAGRVASLALEQIARGVALDKDEIFLAAARQEGHPDNAGPAVYGGLILAAATPAPVTVHGDVGVALAVPERPVETEAARAMLPQSVERHVVVAQAARAAALVRGLELADPELIGYGMIDQLAVPYRKSLIPGFDAAVAAGRDAGGWGVTISGSGSTLVALSARGDVSEVANAMVDALAQNDNPAAPLTPAISAIGLTKGGRAVGR